MRRVVTGLVSALAVLGAALAGSPSASADREGARIAPTAIGGEVISTAWYPLGIDVDDTGNVYIGYANGPATPTGLYVVPRFDGILFGQPVAAGQETLLAPLANIQGVVVDDSGDVLFSTRSGNLYALTETSRTIFGISTTADDSTFIKYLGRNTMGIDLDDSGNLFAAGGPGGGVVVLPAASGTVFGDVVTADTPQPLSMVETDWEGDVALDDSGNLYISQWFGSPRDVLVVAQDSGTLYGQAVVGNSAVPLATFRALAIYPAGIDVDANGTIYVTSWPSTINILTNEDRTVLGQAFTANTAAQLVGSAGRADQGLAVDPTGGLISGADSATLRIRALAAPDLQAVDPASGDVAGGMSATLRGTGFTGALSVDFGGSAASSFTVIDDSTVVAEVPPGSPGTVDVQLSTPGGSSTLMGAFTYTAVPPPPLPAGPPTDPTARSANGSVVVSWSPPASSGSYAISTYQVLAQPSGRSCLTSALSCTMTGLPDGVPQEVRVRALTGAGWGAWSTAVTVTPVASTIRIAADREGRRLTIDGSTSGIDPGSPVIVWIDAGRGVREMRRTSLVSAEGTFVWRKGLKRNVTVRVYATIDGVRSNELRIPADPRERGAFPTSP